ncbi:phosphoribosylglycinamide formyltransferase [Virgibacillus indicus]|uniref:Phosphoribosylglycinamide formyltransferase n=2 Tax=Virgibacillus indicus TaxID=2024554 RepID=A0A265N762_9BACI|nr:phosphoribosylglycinamide formyltransferase [Virgibacillus indicus]
MSKMVKAAVFASGTGSNFDVIMNTEDLACEITLLVCDNPEAQVIQKANKYGVAVFVFNPKDYPSKKAYEQQIVKKLQEAGISWIFLAGYMRIAGPVLLGAFENKIVNIHPSLLPAFPGKDAIGQAFKAGVKITGVTVHFIDEGIDTGPIIAQVPVTVLTGDTETELKERIQKTEHQLYPKVINQLIQAK